ncbi:translation initiation factor IF-2-like [Cervus canadensis]|uniref:translation initiation factor IF-2-like n=1 Tax=Cervus canadensis TaxID=1574408 RepID=UPI001C9E84A6|nr:translation initiation factor IF-2-like [Cervus canadensis]
METAGLCFFPISPRARPPPQPSHVSSQHSRPPGGASSPLNPRDCGTRQKHRARAPRAASSPARSLRSCLPAPPTDRRPAGRRRDRAGLRASSTPRPGRARQVPGVGGTAASRDPGRKPDARRALPSSAACAQPSGSSPAPCPERPPSHLHYLFRPGGDGPGLPSRARHPGPTRSHGGSRLCEEGLARYFRLGGFRFYEKRKMKVLRIREARRTNSFGQFGRTSRQSTGPHRLFSVPSSQ